MEIDVSPGSGMDSINAKIAKSYKRPELVINF